MYDRILLVPIDETEVMLCTLPSELYTCYNVVQLLPGFQISCGQRRGSTSSTCCNNCVLSQDAEKSVIWTLENLYRPSKQSSNPCFSEQSLAHSVRVVYSQREIMVFDCQSRQVPCHADGDLLYLLHVVPERQFEVIGGLGDAGETIVEEDVTAEKQVVRIPHPLQSLRCSCTYSLLCLGALSTVWSCMAVLLTSALRLVQDTPALHVLCLQEFLCIFFIHDSSAL